MAGRVIEQDEVQSLQIVRQLLPWREQLATHFGTRHGNAKLEMFDVMLIMVAGFYNPMVRSQRLVEALSSQQWMQQQNDCKRVPRSTLSDALRRFDPEALRPIIQDLTGRIPALKRQNVDLATITRQILAVDGSMFNLAGDVAWALAGRRGNTDKAQSRVRLDLHLDVRTFSPVDLGVGGAGDDSEAAALRKRIRPNTVYVFDRAYLHFALLNDILEAESNFVLRLRKNTAFEPTAESELTDIDREHDVLSDERGKLTGGKDHGRSETSKARYLTSLPPTQELRRVTVWDERNQCRVVLLTDLLDVPAHLIAVMYRYRWQIELFFKWLKCYARVDHLISKSPQGVTFQFYVAVIATLLLHLATGRKPSKYALFWLGSIAAGTATFEEMQADLARREREAALDKARRARKKAAQKSNP